jgi:hypothetical protein
VCVS